MNPKQLACVVLMAFVGTLLYVGHFAHKKVAAMKAAAESAAQEAATADGERQTAEILTTKAKAETDEIRRFLKTWIPYADKIQTEQQVESAIQLSLRELGISLVRSIKTEFKTTRENKLMPKQVLTTLVIEDEYAKVLNWLGDIEKRLPLARVNACRFTGGSTPRQLRLDVTFETPIVNVAAEVIPKVETTKKS